MALATSSWRDSPARSRRIQASRSATRGALRSCRTARRSYAAAYLPDYNERGHLDSVTARNVVLQIFGGQRNLTSGSETADFYLPRSVTVFASQRPVSYTHLT